MGQARDLGDSLRFASLQQLRAAIMERRLSPLELVDATLDLVDRFEPQLNCFAYLDRREVRLQARNIEGRLRRGDELGPLTGIPIAIKDLITVAGGPTQFGSRVMRGKHIEQDAPVVERIRAAGGIILGKTTTSEFGCKAVGDSPLTGITRNPWNLDKTPGGSSCGAAALVAAGITPVAIGTDGGGSIRIPASMTGLFGIKGQFGRVPVYPASATPTLAHVGPLSRRVTDAATVMNVIAGGDERDPGSVWAQPMDYEQACRRTSDPLRIAWSPTLGYGEPTGETIEIVQSAVTALQDLGHTVDLVERVFPEDPVDLWVAEFYAGVGTRMADALSRDREAIDPEVVVELDAAVAQEMGAYYQSVFRRYDFRETVRKFFNDYDLLVTPTLPVEAFDVGLPTPPTHRHRSIVSWSYYTYPFNLSGHPAASVPAGFTRDGLPVGLQLVAPALREDRLFSVASALEQLRPWSHHLPALQAS
ncbi:amidase [Aquisalimonas asiatica]|uniref:Aspartyl-tRNA(Asn)/glutamyl-tRNA(Gln) amidotransferase subunit A n=1 Tax=Aquisalimonas asiatica TaxID=406100 RepID=A0A1H8RIS4_9GAMM|nr:amidase family protein [Aquisalimonas asiatica]SEO66222.1 aspartyl-tRNA(Asn)/glutamyl-tRNA(Gln) amidotransferase subunit A [Aquisalimonas asiatica]